LREFPPFIAGTVSAIGYFGRAAMKSYSGKTSLVTGASSGIGQALAADLAKRGSNLILTARSKDRLDEQAAQFRAKDHVRVEVIALDLGAEGNAESLFKQVVQRGLFVDLLVNNAGFGKWGNFLDDDLATYAQMLSLNTRAVVELCHLFLPAMTAKGDCGILNVGSTGSFVPVPWSAVYGATKAFVLSFSEALHYEFKDRGVQVTVLCPGATESNFANVAHANAQKGKGRSDSPELVAKIGLDALLRGKSTVIPGLTKHQAAVLPRVLSRARTLRIVGETWKKQLRSRGVQV
jgi:short-subunit dehydrogenase